MKQRCSDCQHLKSAKAGAISERYWCGLTGDGWHITEPKLFDKPRGLVEFRKPCEYAREPYACYPDNCELCPWNILTRLPQSWQYVEELQ